VGARFNNSHFFTPEQLLHLKALFLLDYNISPAIARAIGFTVISSNLTQGCYKV
jgi:hypothetical protein